ncbi:YjcQ family protein [Peribacillus muralis]|nr:YjcQ family protein [Peribacillus muralis]
MSEADFGLEQEMFDDAVNYLRRDGYLKGLHYGDNRSQFFEGTAYLTKKGETYLSKNSTLSKTYKGLKEIRSWLP